MFIEEFVCAVVTNAVITYVISVIFIDTNEKFLIYSIAVCKMTFQRPNNVTNREKYLCRFENTFANVSLISFCLF
jgi:hypothetical protein